MQTWEVVIAGTAKPLQARVLWIRCDNRIAQEKINPYVFKGKGEKGVTLDGACANNCVKEDCRRHVSLNCLIHTQPNHTTTATKGTGSPHLAFGHQKSSRWKKWLMVCLSLRKRGMSFEVTECTKLSGFKIWLSALGVSGKKMISCWTVAYFATIFTVRGIQKCHWSAEREECWSLWW